MVVKLYVKAGAGLVKGIRVASTFFVGAFQRGIFI
jgi:hypothetical protein